MLLVDWYRRGLVIPTGYKTFEPRLNPEDDWKDTYTEHLISEVAVQAKQSVPNTEKGLSA